jgi:translocation and assembly module TamB
MRRRLRSVARTTGRVARAVVAALALLVGGGVLFLHTPWGGETLRRLAVGQIDGAIAGRVAIQRLRFGTNRLRLGGIELRDPEGELVARVRELDVDFSLRALVRRRIDLSRVSIVEPELRLRADGRGLNLTRALASRRSAAPTAPGGAGQGSRLAVEVGKLAIAGGVVDYRAAGGVEPRHARVEDLDIAAHASIRLDGSRIDGAIDGRARRVEPIAAPLGFHFGARVEDHARNQSDAKLRVALGDSAVEATARLDPGGGAAVHVDRLRAVPALLNALLPGLHVRAPIELTADLSRAGTIVDVRADVRAAGAHVHAQGSVDVAAHRARAVVVEGRDVDLGAVVGVLARSRLAFTLHADGGGPDLERLDGALSLAMPPGRLDGAAVGPLAVSVHAARGRIDVRPFALELPGLTIAGGAVSNRGRLDGTFQIHAADLALTARSLASAEGGAPLPVAGRGDVTLHIGGSPQALAIDARGRFAALAAAGQSARGLGFAVQVPDLQRPEIAQAELQSGSAVIGGRTYRDIHLILRSQRREISAGVAVAGGQTLALSLRGRWTRERRAAVIESFSLASGGARWTQQGPLRLGYGAGRATVEGLDLRAGAQRIRADVDAREQKVSARVDVDRLDLAALPRPLLPASIPALEGLLDLHADLSGTRRRPELAARVELTHGRVGRYRGLALALDGRYDGDRARATIAASGLGASVNGKIDVPARWPVRDRGAPVVADLQIQAADVAKVLTAAETTGAVTVEPSTPDGQPVSGPSPGVPPLGGRFAATLHIAGTAGDPTLALHAETSGLRVRRQAMGEIAADIRAGGESPSRASLRFGGGSPAGAVKGRELAVGTVDVETPLSLRTLARGSWPPHRDWLATPVTVRANLNQIALGELAALARRPGALAGTAAVRIDLRGSARAPAGALNLVVLGAHGRRFPETDLRLDAALGARDVRIAAQVARKQRLLAWANVVAGIPAARLGDRAALVDAPLSVRAGAGPVDLRQTPLDGLATTNDGTKAGNAGGAGALHARALVDLAIDGTLRRPTVRANAQLRALRDSTQAGAIQALLTYADRRAALDAQLTSAVGGSARVRGNATLDLGYPAIARGIDAGNAPVDALVEANALDVTWMSGLISPIRRLGGRLTVSARGHGTLGAFSSSPSSPLSVSGRLEWTDGVLALVGYGGYRGIHLVAHGDQHAIFLDGLDARGREGQAHLSGALNLGRDGQQLQLTAKVNRFPIYSQGQLLALLSIDASSKAAIAHRRVDGSVKIGELHAEVADQPKKLQPLDRPNDIVLVADGQPIDRHEAAKLKRLRAGGASGAAGAAPVEPETAPAFTARIAVDAPRNLWLKSNDAELEVGLTRGFYVELGEEVGVFGEVSLGRGHVDLLGRRLELQNGSSARFVGPPAVPIIDVSAKFVDDKDNLTVLLRAQGPLDKLKMDISAPDHPGLTQTQLYTVLVVGHLQSGGDSGGGAATAVSSSALSAEAGSLVAGVLASQLQKVLSKRLPLDVLSIQTGDGLTGSKLEAGKYVSRDIYVGYVGRAGANPALLQNRNAVHLEYQISQRWSFDAEYGDAGTGTADLMWTKRY